MANINNPDAKHTNQPKRYIATNATGNNEAATNNQHRELQSTITWATHHNTHQRTNKITNTLATDAKPTTTP